MKVRVDALGLSATIRECWVLASNWRISYRDPATVPEPTVHSLVIETVKVDEDRRRQGSFKTFLDRICSDPRFAMVVVEGVQNPVLASALERWGWDFDAVVMDFYKLKEQRQC